MGIKCPQCDFENPDDTLFCGKCGTKFVSPEDIAVTETLEAPKIELTTGSFFAGRYQIIEELGKGGMGRVYKAHDKEIKEKVALKLLKPEIAEDERTIERFRNELKLARKIAHKNVCRMYDLNKEEGSYYITMEYVPGEDLKSTIRRVGPLGTGKALFVTKQMCEGLAEAHRLGVVHRDLKPQNIMIDKEGNARIMDFGIARSLKTKGITGTGVMIGTPEYMSPEQAEAKEIDHRSDIYSAGVILYEMVTGRVPFEGDTPLSVAMKHKSEEPPDPKEFNAQIPDELSLLILKCLEKDKEKRFQSAGELSSELINIEKGIPSTERIIPKRKPVTSKEITVTFGLKRILIPALIVTAAVVIGIAVWQFMFKKEAVPELARKPRIAVLPFVDMSPQKDQEYFCDGLAEELINALNHIKGLNVVARTSAFAFKGAKLDVREIGQTLNVGTVLEGSIRKAGNRVRINAQLINVENGYPLWSEKFEREMDDIFAIQDEISMAIVNKLKVNLLAEEEAAIEKRHTQDPEAYNLYLKGLYFISRPSPEAYHKALECFQKAIDRDPNFALAYTGVASVHVGLGALSLLPPQELLPKAKSALSKALELDDHLAEALATSAGIALWYDWDWEAAENLFRKALNRNPGDAWCRAQHAWYQLAMGNFKEAVNEIKRAQELDPLMSFFYAMGIGIHVVAQEVDEAIDQFHKAIELDPSSGLAYFHVGRVYFKKRMFNEALSSFRKSLELTIYPGWAESNIAAIHILQGERKKAEEILGELLERKKSSYVSSYCIAYIYFRLGDIEKTVEFLEIAYEERDTLMPFIKVHTEIDVESDSRFEPLLKKMGL